MSAKQAIVNGASRLLGSRMLGWRRGLSTCGVKLVPLVYHVVSDVHVPHVAHLHGYKSVSQFGADLDFLARNFHPIDPHDLPAVLDGTTKLEKPSFLLTFDDGLREIRDVIAPALLAKGIPAIFFVNSEFVDNKMLFFRHKASLLVDECHKNKDARIALASVMREYSRDVSTELAILAVTHGEQRLLDEAAASIGLDFDAFLSTRRPYLTTAELKGLSKQGFMLGAHSRSHPQYGCLSEEAQWSETLDSLEYMKENFGADNSYFAFPFHDLEVPASVFARMREYGVQVSFGTQAFRRDHQARNVQRLFADIPEASLEQLIVRKCGETLFLRMLGKDKIVRWQNLRN